MIRILIVDDSIEDLENLQDMLSFAEGKFEVDCVQTGAEALDLYKRERHDCVLLDHRLKDEDGLDVLTQLKKLYRACVVIVMAGQSTLEAAKNSIWLGASDYLDKSEITSAVLARKISIARLRAQIKDDLERCVETLQSLPSGGDATFADAVRRSEIEKAMRRSIEALRAMTTAVEGDLEALDPGVEPLRDQDPRLFGELVDAYAGLFDDYLHQLTVTSPKPMRAMRMIVARLAERHCGPRDVLDVHVKALEAASSQATLSRAEAYSVEGRLLALEIMGMLVDRYRRGADSNSDGGD